jgi:hypothetical protein
VRDSVPEPRRAAVEAELSLLNAAADRLYGDSMDRVTALASDRQGLGATEMTYRRLPQQPVPPSRTAEEATRERDV